MPRVPRPTGPVGQPPAIPQHIVIPVPGVAGQQPPRITGAEHTGPRVNHHHHGVNVALVGNGHRVVGGGGVLNCNGGLLTLKHPLGAILMHSRGGL